MLVGTREETYVITDELEPFGDYGQDVHHCNRCHRVVRTYDAVTAEDVAAMLLAHLAFGCVVEPTAGAIAQGNRT